MQPTVFQCDRSKTRRYDLVCLAACLWFAVSSLTEFISGLSGPGNVSWFHPISAVLFGVMAIMFLTKVAGLEIFGEGSRRIRLSLDDEGLTYVRGGLMRTLKFSWADLSEIECQGPALLRRSSVLIRRDAAGLMDWLTMDLGISGPRMRLYDIFDATPKEIAATLNEYRDRALPGARAMTSG